MEKSLKNKGKIRRVGEKLVAWKLIHNDSVLMDGRKGLEPAVRSSGKSVYSLSLLTCETTVPGEKFSRKVFFSFKSPISGIMKNPCTE